MNAIKKPYEILVRYDSDGNLKGAHVAWTHIVTLDDGTVLRTQTPPEPVDIGAGKGFPLADLGGKIAADALIANAVMEATTTAKVKTITDEKAELEEQLQAALSRVIKLEKAKDA